MNGQSKEEQPTLQERGSSSLHAVMLIEFI